MYILKEGPPSKVALTVSICIWHYVGSILKLWATIWAPLGRLWAPFWHPWDHFGRLRTIFWRSSHHPADLTQSSYRHWGPLGCPNDTKAYLNVTKTLCGIFPEPWAPSFAFIYVLFAYIYAHLNSICVPFAFHVHSICVHAAKRPTQKACVKSLLKRLT